MLGAALVLNVGIGVLYGVLLKRTHEDGTLRGTGEWDPVGMGFAGHSFAQSTLICFGVLAITSEFSTGMIRVSLAAVPRRGVLFAAKAAAVGATTLAVSTLTAFATFFTAQAALGGELNAGLGEPGSLRAVLAFAVYLTLLTLISYGVATVLRSSLAALGLLLPLFFIGGEILNSLPGVDLVARYLPNTAGEQILWPRGDPSRAEGLGPWTGLLVMILWTAAALLAGRLALSRRDA
jgi:ABC-2 type transport system permease protein